MDASVYAFPSGHTMTATAIATAARLHRLADALALAGRSRSPSLFAVTMGLSRVYLGVHWPSDVLAGLAFGLAIALIVRLLMPWPSGGVGRGANGRAVGRRRARRRRP